MLIPKEQPYQIGLNSYYLDFEKFIEHLQGEIGSGCLYCQTADQEILVYFDEREIVSGVTQSSGERAQVSSDLDSVLLALSKRNFLVTVYFLDAASIFYWGEMPAFQRNKNKVKATELTLAELANRLLEKQFTGFIDVDMGDLTDSAILFFYQGKRRGGSYSWGKGGLSPSEDDYNRLLLSMEGVDTATFAIGRFIDETLTKFESALEDSSLAAGAYDEEKQKFPDQTNTAREEEQNFSNLDTALNEFISIYLEVIQKKCRYDPIVQLKQKFLENLSEYPLLDPFKRFFDFNDDLTISFAEKIDMAAISAGIVDCTWQVIEENKLENKFRSAVFNWDFKVVLEECGITMIR